MELRSTFSFLALSSQLAGCSTLAYLAQAGKGQLSVMNHARPIAEVLSDPKTSPRLKTLLAETTAIKAFGERNGLRPTPNYADFVQLDGSAASWVVSACDPLAFRPREWRFWIVGSFTYLGWFDRADADKHAASLRAEGLDVYVRGATAYSTLGWFRDPIFSSMIGEGDEAIGALANVILHESVHTTVYLKSQSYFNESLASFVADKLTPSYLAGAHGAAQAKAYEDSVAAGESRRERFHRAYLELESIYSAKTPDPEKLAAKDRILARLKEDTGWKRELNNAVLIQFKTYDSGVSELEQALAGCQGDIRAFVAAMARIPQDAFLGDNSKDIGPVVLRHGCG